MAIVEYAELDGVTVGGTEVSLITGTTTPATETADGIFQAWIDAGNMAKGDEYVVRAYEKVEATGGVKKVFASWMLMGVQTQNFCTPSFILMHGWDFTIQKLAGTDRAFDASVRQIS